MNVLNSIVSGAKFVNGNTSGARTAISGIIARPVFKGIAYMSGADTAKFNAHLDKVIVKNIKESYVNGGAPKSGEFFTQNISEVAKKLITIFRKK